MANPALVAKIFRATLFENYYQQNVWRSLVDDVSAEIPEGHDSIDMPYDDLGYEVKDVDRAEQLGTNATQLARGAPHVVSGSKRTLQMQTYGEIDELVGTFTSMNTLPNFLASAARHSARVIIEVVNGAIRTQFDASTEAVAGPITVKAADYGKDDHKTAIINALRAASVKADEEHWPREGRYCVMSPSYLDLIIDDIIESKFFFVSGVNDMAAVNNQLPRYRGWDLIMDDSMSPVKTASTANHFMYFGRRGVGVGVAVRLRGLRVYESEVYRGMRANAELQYGTLINEPSKLLLQKTTIQA